MTKRYGKGINSTCDDGAIIAFYPTGGSQNGFWDTTGVSPTIKVGSGVGASNGIAIVNALDRQQGGADDNSAQAGHLVAETITAAFMAGQGSRAGGQVVPFDTNFSNQATPGGDISATLDTRGKQGVAQAAGFSSGQSADARSIGYEEGLSPTLRAGEGGNSIPKMQQNMTVRRLTPVECERLMGLPDGWTAPEGVKAPDSKRYAACGDAIVTTVAFWIADRIRMIEEEEAS